MLSWHMRIPEEGKTDCSHESGAKNKKLLLTSTWCHSYVLYEHNISLHSSQCPLLPAFCPCDTMVPFNRLEWTQIHACEVYTQIHDNKKGNRKNNADNPQLTFTTSVKWHQSFIDKMIFHPATLLSHRFSVLDRWVSTFARISPAAAPRE